MRLSRLHAGLLALLAATAPLASVAAQDAGLGSIDFPTSASPAAAPHFERGVLALHNFWMREARSAFRAAQQAEPAFALAYWGEALTYAHPLWITPDRPAALATLARLAPDSSGRLARARDARERAYLRAVERLFAADDPESGKRAYVLAMADLVAAYPEDDEAAALYAHALHTMLPMPRHAQPEWREVVALLERVFRRNPMHPGAAHYLIHVYDDPELASRGLQAALAYSAIAPASPHALHMPSHIFVQLGRWDDVIAANEAAFAASDAWVRGQGLPLERRDYHALSWLAYGYLQAGRWSRVEALLAELEAVQRETSSSLIQSHLDEMRARYVVETRRCSELPLPPRNPPSAPLGDGNALFAAGFCAAMRADSATVREARLRLDSLSTLEQGSMWGSVTGIMSRELGATLLYRQGQREEAIRQLEALAREEARLGIPSGPPEVLAPVRELLGELLLETGRSDAAAAEFRRALERTPQRTRALLGLARAERGRGADASAEERLARLRAVLHQADPDVLLQLTGWGPRQ